MPEICINDVIIQFPFEPYDIQKEYMLKIIKCLQNKSNGLLESPTGTGKTLSLLCSSLAWLKKEISSFNNEPHWNTSNINNILHSKRCSSQDSLKSCDKWNEKTNYPPKIVYASRTHSQLSQVMLELKKTTYNDLKIGVLGSRDQLCIHPRISAEKNTSTKVEMCKVLVNNRKCYFYNNVETRLTELAFQEFSPIDIEDLVKKGKQNQCCPYFASRKSQNNVNILFAPYNYLLDAKIRKAHEIQLQNDVIILDEAHNIEKVCEESFSSQLASSNLALCIKEVTMVMKVFQKEIEQNGLNSVENVSLDVTEDQLINLKQQLILLEKVIDEVNLENFKDKTASKFPGSFIFTILEKAEITPSNIKTLLDILYKICQYLAMLDDSQLSQRGIGCSKLIEFLQIVFESLGPENSTNNTDFNFKVYIEEISKNDSQSLITGASIPRAKTINFWCFNPGFGMKSLIHQGVRCIILTSGTLSPMNALISELAISVDVRLSNPHIIKSNQICAVIVEKGPANTDFRCVYQNRSNEKYLSDLGKACLNFFHVIPGGILVFFPSYPFLIFCVEFWKRNGEWNKMNAVKNIFVEPREKDLMKSVIEDYYKIIEEKSNASLFAVFRGKVSEGLDFTNSKARAVIVTGIPYPSLNDPKIILKKEYLDECKRKCSWKLNGSDWYQLEAMKAVNQAIGRVIRHANDYGAIIFCDCRFSFSNNIENLSHWIQPFVTSTSSFGQSLKTVSNFFKQWKDCSISSNSLEETQIMDKNFKDKVESISLQTYNLFSDNNYSQLYSATCSTRKCVSVTKEKSILSNLEDSPCKKMEENTSMGNALTDNTKRSSDHLMCFTIAKKKKITLIGRKY